MTIQNAIQQIRPRLAADGFEFFEDVPAGSATFRLVARRSRFEFSKFGFHEVFFVFSELGQPDIAGMRAFSAAAFRHALSMKKIPLPRGLFEAVSCYCVALVKAVDPTLAESTRKNTPTRHWAAFEIPVVWNPEGGQLFYFEKTPIWGAAYYRGFRKQLEKYFAGARRGN